MSTLRTMIVGDLHGDYQTCQRLLRQEGVLDELGHRTPGWHVVQVGDLIHGGHNEYERDLIMTKKAATWFDIILIGNHELPHAFPKNGFPRFAGMTPLDSRVTDSLKNNPVAYAVGDWLITHGGLHPSLAIRYGVPASAAKAAEWLNERFEYRLTLNLGDPVSDWIGQRRGGGEPVGGIFWNDWRDMVWDVQYPVKQVMGHTPRPAFFETDPTGNLWCVDAGAALSGSASALISTNDGGWRGVSYTRNLDVQRDPHPPVRTRSVLRPIRIVD